jgi:hypothetical protein
VNSFTALLAMLPGAAAGGPVQAGGSLAALDKAMGKDTGKRRRLDVWFDARWQGVQAGGSAGNFAAGAVGLDYRLTEKVVIGAFASVDHGSLAQTAGAGRVSGIGWVAGTYAGARISKNLILQGVLAGGTSWNTVSPLGTYTDSYTTTRFIASTSLAGDWKRGAWTFSPTVSLSYATETSAEYVDTPGNTIAAATTGVFEGSAGPGFRYRHVSDNGVVVEPGLKLDVIARLASGGAGAGTTTLFGRLTPSIQLGFAGGAGLRLTTNVEVGANFLSYGASARATLPLR